MSQEPELLTTALTDAHAAEGAHLVDFAGWRMPLRYTSQLAEHQAVRERAGLFDLSHMAQIFVSGTDSAEALGRCFISPVGAMSIGRAKYSMLTAADGGILDDLIIYRLAEDDFLVVANASNRDVVVDALTKRCGEVSGDITVADRTLQRSIIAIQGPAAPDILTAAGLEEGTELRYYAICAGDGENSDVLIARTGYTGEDGFELYLDRGQTADMWARLREAGESYGLALCGLAARDTLRLEAGMPLYGNELNADLSPADVGMGRMVKLDHDFVGRDALATREARYALIGLSGEGRRAARAGSRVLCDGEDIGEVTSGVLSPTLGHPIALARVTREAPEVGTEVSVDVRGTAQPMTVTALPFYSRKK
ncbi:MAG: glycine cleavage system aminomethyltransferase GcvT [Bowdeniella nasicola]|nr:glycine cleavage system aminomethyltransferase GcvT [Bowdeniella nasicola]